MLQPLNIGILDLCKRSDEKSAACSMRESIELACIADRAGFKRYWIAEHHTDDAAQACPEVLLPLLCSSTKTIRIGSGGVLLKYQSPLKICETFLAIEALFPGRIDLGICKGPGVTCQQTAEALVCGNPWELSDEAFEQKADDLVRFLWAAAMEKPRSPEIVTPFPWGVSPPPLWILGSGSHSAKLAARLGRPYGFTLLFDPKGFYGRDLMAQYHREFVPSAECPAPQSLIVAFIVCSESSGEAERQNRKLLEYGYQPGNVVGNPKQCCEQLHQLAHDYQSREVLAATLIERFEDRAYLYSALSEELHLADRTKPSGSMPSEQAC